jgi:hypothetical protein
MSLCWSSALPAGLGRTLKSPAAPRCILTLMISLKLQRREGTHGQRAQRALMIQAPPPLSVWCWLLETLMRMNGAFCDPAFEEFTINGGDSWLIDSGHI